MTALTKRRVRRREHGAENRDLKQRQSGEQQSRKDEAQRNDPWQANHQHARRNLKVFPQCRQVGMRRATTL